MTTPTDSFYSPKRRLSRANNHIEILHGQIEAFFGSAPCHSVAEMDADGITNLLKLKFTKRIPESCIDSAAEAVEALRSTLDQTGYAAAVASGKVAPKRAYFPIGDDPEGLNNVIKLGKSKDLPNDILSLFVAFKPYKGGNDAIWALNKIRHSTHTILTPVGVVPDAAYILHMSDNGLVDFLPNPIWDSEKNEIIFARVKEGGKIKYDLVFSFLVALGDIDFITRHQAVAVLRAMAGEVERILRATEAECRRLGFIT